MLCFQSFLGSGISGIPHNAYHSAASFFFIQRSQTFLLLPRLLYVLDFFRTLFSSTDEIAESINFKTNCRSFSPVFKWSIRPDLLSVQNGSMSTTQTVTLGCQTLRCTPLINVSAAIMVTGRGYARSHGRSVAAWLGQRGNLVNCYQNRRETKVS